MVSPELLGYIRAEIKNNASHEDIRSRLTLQGWTSGDVGEAFAIIDAENAIRIPAPGPTVTASPMAMSEEVLGTRYGVKKESKGYRIVILLVILLIAIGYAAWVLLPSLRFRLGTQQHSSQIAADVVPAKPLTDEATKAQVKVAYVNLKSIVDSGDLGAMRAYIESTATTPEDHEKAATAPDSDILTWIEDTKAAYAAINETALADGSANWIISGDGNEVIIQKGFMILLFKKINGEWR